MLHWGQTTFIKTQEYGPKLSQKCLLQAEAFPTIWNWKSRVQGRALAHMLSGPVSFILVSGNGAFSSLPVPCESLGLVWMDGKWLLSLTALVTPALLPGSVARPPSLAFTQRRDTSLELCIFLAENKKKKVTLEVSRREIHSSYLQKETHFNLSVYFSLSRDCLQPHLHPCLLYWG